MSMSRVYKKCYTMPMPAKAEDFERNGVQMGRWRLRNGQSRTAEIVPTADSRPRVRGESKYYMAQYRDGNGQTVEIATQCRDEAAARAVLAQRERRAELVRAGVLTEAESGCSSHASV